MRSNGTSLKRGSTPSAPKNSGTTNITRKIVDATTHMPQLKKSPNIGLAQHQLRQHPKEDLFYQQNKIMQNEKLQSNSIFDNFQQKHAFNAPTTLTNPTVSLGGSGLFASKQHKEIQQSYQAFGVQENDKAYPSPQTFSKKGEQRRDDMVSHEVYKDLQNRFERIQVLYEEEKKLNRELEERLKKKEAQYQLINKTNQKNMAEVSLSRIKIRDLFKEVLRLQDHIRQLQEQEESKENQNEQMLAMIYALRLHQQEEQQIQQALQQSAVEVGDNPNFINIDNMTYEELLELEERNGKVSKGLPQQCIDELEIVQFDSDIQEQQERCTICINDFEIGEELKCLPCQHVYHSECVDSWLQREKVCPLCKKEVISDESSVSNHRQ